MTQPRPNPAEKVALNPQPLPPRWLPGPLGALYIRLLRR
jgi:hypothetical protein